MTEATIVLDDPQRVLSLFGPRDQHLRAIRETLGVTVLHRDGEIRLAGEEGAVAKAKDAFGQLNAQLTEQGSIEGDQVADLLARLTGKKIATAPPIDVVNVAKRIAPRTPGQARYVKASASTTSSSRSVRPAPARPTWPSPWPSRPSSSNRSSKIVLVRPAVEAGESLGFLPGDLHAKINPYLRPLLDALTR